MNKKIIVLSIAFVISMVINLMLLLPYIEIEEKVLENKITEREKTYAIMVQTEDKTGYVESTSEIWPSGMILNLELTNCTDEDGQKIENALSYEDGNVIVETNKKIYCYLYFDVGNVSFGNSLLENPTSGLNITLEGGLYRYQGANGTVSNYVCFGTSDKDSCLANTDAYIYRIIGITEDGRIKVIKNEALENPVKWHKANDSTTWENSYLFAEINGSTFLNNLGAQWSDKIETTTWKYGYAGYVNKTPLEVYQTETSWSTAVEAKIGLIHIHDYYYAYQSGGVSCASNASTCKTSWMHLSNCDPSAPSPYEWVISRFLSSNSAAYYIYSDGKLSSAAVTDNYSVRPVFYLKSDVSFGGGTGTSNDPFIIN